MNSASRAEAIQFPIDRPVEVGRFVFASKGGTYRFMLEPVSTPEMMTSYEIVAEWCEFGEQEPSDGGYDFWGGSRRFHSPQEALGAMYEWIARAALEEKFALDMDLQGEN